MKPLADKYFNNYKMTEVINESGNGTVKKLRYYGEYYIHDISDKRWKLQKKAFFIYFLLITSIYIFSLTRDVAGSYVSYVAAPPLLLIIPLLLLFMGSIKNIFNNRRMTKNDYNESILFMRVGSILAMVINFLVIICQIIFITNNGTDFSINSDLFVMLCYVLNFFVILTMYITLKKFKFNREKS